MPFLNIVVSSVIIDNLHVCWAFARPTKTDAKLIVNPNAVLTSAITLQRLQAIARRRTQKVECMCCVKLRQLPNRNSNDARKPPAFSLLEQRLRIGTTEALDHIFRL